MVRPAKQNHETMTTRNARASKNRAQLALHFAKNTHTPSPKTPSTSSTHPHLEAPCPGAPFRFENNVFRLGWVLSYHVSVLQKWKPMADHGWGAPPGRAMWTTPEFAHFTEIMRKLADPSVMMAVHPRSSRPHPS